MPKGCGEGSKATQFLAKTHCSDCRVALTPENKRFGRCLDCAKKAAVERVLRWKARHPERAKEVARRTDAKRLRNDPVRKAASITALRKWIVENPERVRISHALRQTKRRATYRAGDLTVEQWQTQLEVFGHCCAYCLAEGVPLTMDHVIPLKHGGPHTIDNVVPACGPCNSTKQARGPLAMVNRMFQADKAGTRGV